MCRPPEPGSPPGSRKVGAARRTQFVPADPNNARNVPGSLHAGTLVNSPASEPRGRQFTGSEPRGWRRRVARTSESSRSAVVSKHEAVELQLRPGTQVVTAVDRLSRIAISSGHACRLTPALHISAIAPSSAEALQRRVARAHREFQLLSRVSSKLRNLPICREWLKRKRDAAAAA